MDVSIPPTTPPQLQPPRSLNLPSGLLGKAIVIACILCLILAGLYFVTSPKITRTITAVGNGKVQFEAQKAELTILLVNRGANKQDLTTTSKKEFADVVENLQRLQVDNVSQSAAQIVPLSSGSTPDGQVVFNNFEYRQAAQVIVSSQEKIREVSDFLSTRNVFIAQNRYLPPDQSKVDGQLLQAALEDATTKANDLAKSSHLHIGKILNISEVSANADNSGLVSVKSTTAPSDQLANTPNSNQIELQKTISVTFELK
jgi:uncharacterized protein YggE